MVQQCRHSLQEEEDEAGVCGAGCRRACRYYLNQNVVPSTRPARVRAASLAPIEFSERPILRGCQLTWGRPGLSANSLRGGADRQKNSLAAGGSSSSSTSRPVYLLLGRDGAGQWYEVNQTEMTRTLIAVQTLAKLHELLLVAVGRHGVLISAQLPVDQDAVLACRPDGRQPVGEHQQQRPHVSLETMETDGVLFRAVISWTVPSEAYMPSVAPATARYLVRWRTVPEGFMAGSLLTNQTRAVLALLPSSHVVVEVSPLLLLDDEDGRVDHRQLTTSSPLLISTFNQAAIRGSDPAIRVEATLVVALLSLALSLLAFLVTVVRFYRSRMQKKLAATPAQDGAATSSYSNNNNNNISSSSDNYNNNSCSNNIKKMNEEVAAQNRPVSSISRKEFKFPVKEVNLAEKQLTGRSLDSQLLAASCPV